MKKHVLIPAVALAGGALALALRLVENLTAYEAATGLPLPGSHAHLLVLLALLATAVVVFALTRKLPREASPGPAFPAAFSTENAALLTPSVMGVGLLAVSGVVDVLAGLGMGPAAQAVLLTAEGMVFPRNHLLMGALTLVTAGCLFPAVVACRSGREDVARKTAGLLLAPPICAVARLVLTYRENSVDPTLAAYDIELLALAFLTLALYRLSSFAFRSGRTGRFALYTGVAAALCLTTLADGHLLSDTLFYAGGAVTLLGFLLLRLSAPAWEPPAEGETSESGD